MVNEDRAFFDRVIQPVSHETIIKKLETFAGMLVEWNERFNLVGKSTLPHIWERHMADSAQLIPLLPKKPGTILADMGSGAGFPGLVLAIMTGYETHLIESTGKKASFLEAVAKEVEAPVVVHNERIEEMRGLKADVVTARALTALPDLIKYAKPLMKKGSFCLFLKGKNLDEELTEARKKERFKVEKTRSLTSDEGWAVKIHLTQL